MRCLLDIAGNLLRCAALLVDGGRDHCRNFRNPADRGSNLFDRQNRVLGRNLHSGDLTADFIGCFRGLRCERLHFLRHNRKAASGFTRASCLDRGVQRQHIGLFRDRRDEIDHVANP